MTIIAKILARILAGAKSNTACVREAHHMRSRLTERQIDKILADSFPASDPPAWY